MHPLKELVSMIRDKRSGCKKGQEREKLVDILFFLINDNDNDEDDKEDEDNDEDEDDLSHLTSFLCIVQLV